MVKKALFGGQKFDKQIGILQAISPPLELKLQLKIGFLWQK